MRWDVRRCIESRALGVLWQSLLALMVGTLLSLILWKVPVSQVHRFGEVSPVERAALENEYRKTLAQIIGTFGLLIGLYVIWRRLTPAERTMRLALEQDITEHFTRAIAPLGDSRLAIRLGGIHALERLAESATEDLWPIVEVLAAFVRENAPWTTDEQSRPSQPAMAHSHTQEEDSLGETVPSQAKLPTDIQAALTVLGLHKKAYENTRQRLDLHRTVLCGASLEGAHLEGAFLQGSHLECAVLVEAHLEGAVLMGAHLQEADLRGAYLQEAVCVRANLEGTSLVRAHLERAVLAAAHLEGAVLMGAHLQEADLRGAYLEDVIFVGTHLEGADLRGTLGLTRAQIEFAFTDDDTRLPDNLKAPAEPEDEE